MKLPRISIARLMGIVLVAALGLVGLMRPEPAWARLIFTAAVGVLTVAVLNVIYGPKSARPFWVGFSIAGWIFWMMAFAYPPTTEDAGPPSIISAGALEWLWDWLHPASPDTSLSMTFSVVTNGSIAASGTQYVPTATPILPVAPPLLSPIPSPTTPDDAAAAPTLATTAVEPASSGSPSLVSPIPTPAATPPTPATPPMVSSAAAASLISPLVTLPSQSLSFFRVGQSLTTLLAGLLGGAYASFAARRRAWEQEREAAPAASGVNPSSL